MTDKLKSALGAICLGFIVMAGMHIRLKAFIVAWSILAVSALGIGASRQASGQEILLNHDYGTVSAAAVERAAWSIQQRTGITLLPIAGTTHSGCVPGAIVVRYAGETEDVVHGFITSDCDAPQQMQIIARAGYDLWEKSTVFQHEMGHAAGCFMHIGGPHLVNSLRADLSGEFITKADTNCITGAGMWPITGAADLCFVEVNPEQAIYIPSIAGLQVWLRYAGVSGGYHTWTQVRSVSATHSCPGNTLVGSVAEFDDVRGYGLPALSYARLRHMGGTTWRLEAAY